MAKRDISEMLRSIDERQAEKRAEREFQLCDHFSSEHRIAMMSNAEAARSFLGHADPELRIAAISVFVRYHGQCPELSSILLEIMQKDSDPQVRLHATIYLINCHMRSKNDQAAARLLASIIRDAAVADEIRLSCYVVLTSILNVPLVKCPKRLPEDVNWLLVDHVMKTGDT